MKDCRGNPVSTHSEAALAHFEHALWCLVSFYDTPLADLDEAALADPGWMLPPVMRAAFLLTLTEPGLVPQAREALVAAEALAAPATPRERAHLAAAKAAAAGRWREACTLWEALLIEHPRDLLALTCAHLFDFYRGDALNLRQRIARVLPEWDAADPLRPFVLGMHAFGLEECNLYSQAEAAGREALAVDPRGPWAIHAVTHVMEMQGRHDDGAQWLRETRPHWAIGNGLAGHNAWHLALFHLERLDTAAALAVYDEFLDGEAAQEVHLQRLDSAALLWRLKLLGVDGGERWQSLAARYASANDTGFYAFNDLFALLAFIGAGEMGNARAVLRNASRRARSRPNPDVDNTDIARQVGLPLMRGMLAFAERRMDDVVQAIEPMRDIAHRFGGSHAQRDLIHQTLLAAAADGTSRDLGLVLLNERRIAKPQTALTRYWMQRMGA